MIDEKIKNVVDIWSNSFYRPLTPPKLLSNSKILGTEDDGAKLIYLKFLYGIKTGHYATRPTDGRVGNIIKNLDTESLWSYSLKNIRTPENFTTQNKIDSGIIGTGEVKKCGTCKGHGKVRCSSCGGKIRWTTTNSSGDRVENVCSCGDGKEMCRECEGYCDVEIVIETQKEYKLFETKNSQYTGEVPEEKIKKITGHIIYEQIYEYPLDTIQEMLIGGIDSEEFNKLNDSVLKNLKENINDQLIDRGDIDTNKIHTQLDSLFNSLPNPGRENKVLKHEAMPIRVMVRVENAPVKQINYNYKDKEHQIWVYGNEYSIWKQKTPISFNYKIIMLLLIVIGLICALIFMLL